jgi:hypothetical protein
MPVSDRIARERQARYDRRMAQAEAVVPHGSYCYTPLSVENGRMTVKVCPHWKHNPRKRSQETGYCRLLKSGDWMQHPHGTSLLWDYVKGCGVNPGSDEPDVMDDD